MIKGTKTLNLSTYELDAMKDAILKTLDNAVITKEILDGIPLNGVEIGMTATIVNHRLGRTPLGYIVVGKNGFGDIYDTERNSKTITLISSAVVIANLWVY